MSKNFCYINLRKKSYKRNFWKNERPTSTEYETETESQGHSESEAGTVNLVNEIKICHQNLKTRNKLISQLKNENEAVNAERNELEIELINCQSRIKQLESENRQYQREKQKWKSHLQEKDVKLKSSEERYLTFIKCE